jgi:hypothetical protein
MGRRVSHHVDAVNEIREGMEPLPEGWIVALYRKDDSYLAFCVHGWRSSLLVAGGRGKEKCRGMALQEWIDSP